MFLFHWCYLTQPAWLIIFSLTPCECYKSHHSMFSIQTESKKLTLFGASTRCDRIPVYASYISSIVSQHIYILPSTWLCVCLTGESSLCQKFLCRPVENKHLEGIFLTGVQSCHCCTTPRGGQHQLRLWHLWKLQRWSMTNVRFVQKLRVKWKWRPVTYWFLIRVRLCSVMHHFYFCPYLD